MNIGFLTFYDIQNPKYNQIGNITYPGLSEYCKDHNYTFLCETKFDASVKNPYWYKIELVLKHISKFDWIVWCDIDVFVLNKKFNMESIINSCETSKKNMAISMDGCGICAGFFMLKNCEWSKKFLDSLLFLNEVKSDIKFTEYENEGDQLTIKCFYRTFPSVREKLLLLDLNFMADESNFDFNKDYVLYHLVSHSNGIDHVKSKLDYIQSYITKRYGDEL
jgi:hypothetical protein